MMRSVLLVGVLIIIGVAIWYLNADRHMRTAFDNTISTEIKTTNHMDTTEKEKKYPQAQELTQIAGFINAPEFTLKDLVGKKVILVDFWTYSCINCQRTTPYLNAWYEKYHDKGLEIVGVHTPEFEFEKNYENVKRATTQYGIKYPVVLDNEYGTWNAYKNRYWPRKYLIDIDGFIVYDHIGEGGYDETERKIQELLTERMSTLGVQGEIANDIARPAGVEDVDNTKPKSPEIYFGALRNTYLGNGASAQPGAQIFTAPTGIKTNILYLAGDWNIKPEYAENNSKDARIIFRYQGEKVFMVAGSATPTQARILLDGKPISKEAGQDVKGGVLEVSAERLYRLVEHPGQYGPASTRLGEAGEHTLEIIMKTPGFQAFTFTFG